MRKRMLILVAVGLVSAGVVGTATYAAFSSTTANPGDSFAAGTVYLTDNDSGNRMFSFTNAKPGNTASSCIAVTYGGTLASTVRLYATVAGSLPPYLSLTVTRGIGAAGFGNCTGFTSTGTGDGTIYSGTLGAFPSSYASGIVDPQSWSTNDVHVYKFDLSFPYDPNAQALAGSADFTWEARNT
jgi:Camelysin metallo-endopeptidase